MADHIDYLITGAGGAVGGVSSTVVEQLVAAGASVRAFVHRDGPRADALRAIGADVATGDLTDPADVVAALAGVKRVFFNMGVSDAYLEATAIIAAAGRAHGCLETLVNMSQMTVSEMTLTSTGESRQHRLHWLAERVLDWSGLPVTHVRPTAFIDNPLFTFLNAESVGSRGVLALPLGTASTSPVAAADVARVVTELLLDPTAHREHVYELTGPELLDLDGLARSFSRALGRPITGENVPLDAWRTSALEPAGLPPHVEQHIGTMARLHHDGRYARMTGDVERVTGRAPMSVEQYVAAQPQKFTR